MNMKVSLTPKEVEQIIKDHLAAKFKTVGDITIEVGKELRGHYTNEHYEAVFQGITCEVEM